jgi:hypothetical protein
MDAYLDGGEDVIKLHAPSMTGKEGNVRLLDDAYKNVELVLAV